MEKPVTQLSHFIDGDAKVQWDEAPVSGVGKTGDEPKLWHQLRLFISAVVLFFPKKNVSTELLPRALWHGKVTIPGSAPELSTTLAPNVMDYKQEWLRWIANHTKAGLTGLPGSHTPSRCKSQHERWGPGTSDLDSLRFLVALVREESQIYCWTVVKWNHCSVITSNQHTVLPFFPHRSPLTHFPSSSSNCYLHYLKNEIKL